MSTPATYTDAALDALPHDALTGRRCLVTGGLGFIGSNLALDLARRGARVTVLDARVPRHGANPYNLVPDGAADVDGSIVVIDADLAESWGEGARSDIRDAAAAADLVFNLAGQVSHVDSMTDPLFDLSVNTTSQFAFLELLRAVNPGVTVVYTSTRQIFGKPRYLPVDEEHPVNPVDVNGITKYAAEQLHLLYHEVHGLQASAVRLTNVYGPRQRLTGDLQGFLPIFVRRALADESITVFGEGEQQRDCLYVDDVVECLELAALTPDAAGQIFNVGNDERLSLAEIARCVVDVVGSGRVEHVPWPADRDAIDIGSYFGDSSKAKRILAWEPRTGFAEGMDRTVAFFRDRLAWYS